VSVTLFLAYSTVNFVDYPDMLQKFFTLILENEVSSDMPFQHFYFSVRAYRYRTEGRSGPVTLPPRSRLISTGGRGYISMLLIFHCTTNWYELLGLELHPTDVWTELGYKYMCWATRGASSECRYTANCKSQKIDRI